MKPSGVIYELLDPRDGRCRYIGQSFSPKAREKSHTQQKPVWQQNAMLYRWKKELADAGLSPVFRVVESAVSPKNINERERDWAAQRSASGCELLNCAVGSIRRADLLPGSKRAELAEAAIEMRDVVFAIQERLGLPIHHKATKELRKCCDSLLAFWSILS